MREMDCKNCGAKNLTVRNGYWICPYCDSKFMVTADDFYSTSNNSSTSPAANSGISLDGDIKMLLHKCRMNPKNARKYANLILDIDPDNEEALKYL